MNDDDVLRLDDVLADLAAGARLAELVELHFVTGLTFAEVAALRGEPSAPCRTIGTRLARCSTAPWSSDDLGG